MATQVIGAGRRSQVIAALVALALALAVLVIATQASSIWATGNRPQVRPVSVDSAASAETVPLNGSQIPAGCWVKFGCERGGGASRADMAPLNGSHIPDGCRVKFGCEREGRGAKERP